jgi:tripartite-type tricarboxylate transporter receptor subunit TctC
MKRYAARLFATAILLALPLGHAAAQAEASFPTRPVRLINPFPPGAVSDAMLRGMASWLSKKWDQPVVVESKPGAGGLIAADYVAKSSPDGHTIGLVLPAIAIGAATRSSMTFDPLKDLASVTQLASIPLGLFTNPDRPFRTIPELIQAAKREPGKLTFGSVGVGSSSHMAGELFKVLAKVDLVHVPYKGSVAAQVDLVAGRIDLFFDAVGPEVEYLKAGKVRMLGVADPNRLPAYPEHETIEASVPGYVVNSWFGMVVPAGTPASLIDHLNRDLVEAVRSEGVAGLLESRSMVVVGSSPAAFALVIRDEIEKWKKVVGETGIRID